MTYRIPPETLLRRVAYHGRLPFACPLACDVRGEGGTVARATYVDGSMLERPGCRHRDADECTRMTRRLPRWRADEDYR